MNRARGAGGRELDAAAILVEVGVEPPAEALIELLRALDIRHGDGDHLELQIERRGALAQWMTSESNPYFAKALVNRMWSELNGEGFYEPVDDIGPDRDCVAPQTLDYLAGQFANSGYDVKWLFQTIMATELYHAESRSRRGPEDPPMQHNVAQRLRR